MSRSAGKIFLRSFIFLSALGAFFLLSDTVLAGASQNVSGYAWSENIGWISFNNTSGGGSQNYGVNLNTANGEFSGYAWSENIGWISFERAVTGAPPLPPYNGGESYIAKMDLTSFQLSGWARALVSCTNNLWDGAKCTGSGAGDATDGWDGWIKLSGTAQDGSLYGVTVNKKNGLLYGYAWGGFAIGWMSFNCANTNSCAGSAYQVNSPYAPAAYWKLDDQVSGDNKAIADSSGNAYSGATHFGPNASGMNCAVSGKTKGACSFDGVDDYISAAPIQAPQDISIEAWVMLQTVSLSGPVAIVDQRNGAVVDWELWFLAPSNEFRFGAGGASFGTVLPFPVSPGVWYHIAAVKQGNLGRLYVNGIEYGSNSGLGTIANTGTAHAIGSLSQGSGEFFPGSIDDVVFYGYARSGAQILSDYQSASFPVLYFPFDDNVSGEGKRIADASGNGGDGITHWGANGSGMNCAVPGRYGFGCQFDGVDDYVDGPAASSINQTQEAWIKLTSVPADGRITSRSSCGNGRLYIVNGAVKWEFGDSAACQSIQSATTLQVGTWYHIAATNDNGVLAIYINGVLDKIGTYTLNPMVSSALTIGSYGGSAAFFPGVIDEVRIYSYARTAAQIFTDKENMVAYWQFNEGTGGAAEDQTFYRNDGAITNALFADDTVLGSHLAFNGGNASVLVPDNPSLDITKEITVSAWVKRASAGTYDVILSKPSDNAVTHHKSNYQLYISDSNDKAMWRIYKSQAAGEETLLTSATAIQPNRWYFIAGTYRFTSDNNSQMALYVSGALEASRVSARGPIETSTVDLSIGAHTTRGEFFDGLIEEVRLYPRALTDGEISDIYFERALRAPQNVVNPPGASFNSVNTITFTWDTPIDEANSYVVYAEVPNSAPQVLEFSGISNAVSYMFSERNNIDGSLLSFAPFIEDTSYTVYIASRDVLNRKLDSVFSLPGIAATSAKAPQGVQAALSSSDGITWVWTPGGASGFYAEMKSDPGNTSGWIPDTQTTWTASQLSCGVLHTVRVKAKNRDGDETAWSEGFGSTLACAKSCATALQCASGEVCALMGSNKQCVLENQCALGAWCNKLFNGSGADGLCVQNGPARACNLPSIARIFVQSIDHGAQSASFSAETSDDDITPVSGLITQWDFNYSAGNPLDPNWSDTGNFDYTDAVSATTIKTYTYPGDGSYTVALQVKDALGAESPIVFKDIVISSSGGKIIAISPEAFPATNAPYMYDFGLLKTGSAKSIAMLICNLGGQALSLNSLNFAVGAPFTVSSASLPFTLFPDANGPPGECGTNNDSLSWKFITLDFSPLSDGAFTDTFTISSDAENGGIDVSLKGQSRAVTLTPDVPVESVIYDGRTIINPPPGFVEFLESIRSVEPAKPR